MKHHLLGFQYVLESSGSLSNLKDETFDLIFSFDVLEHIKSSIVADYIQDVHRLLKPGGYSIHQIDLADHLAYFDPGVHGKYYMKHSDKAWKYFFENEVLYFCIIPPYGSVTMV